MSENISEVSCRVLGILFQELPKKDLPLEALTDGITYPLEHLQNAYTWIDWKSFCLFMRNAGSIWSDEELVGLGHKFIRSQFARPGTTIARLFFTPKEFFQWVSRHEMEGRNHYFNCAHGLLHDRGPHLLEFDLTLLSGYQLSPEFFTITKGAFAAMPTALGLGEAYVEMAPIPGGVRYTIRLPSGGGTLAWLRRLFTWPFTIRAAAKELKEVNEQLQLRYRQLEEEIQERKRAEEALQITERRFRQLAENIEEVFFLASADETVLYYINPAYERITGRSRESLYAAPRSWVEALYPDDRQWILKRWENWGPEDMDKEQDVELRVLHPDGSMKWVWLRSQPIYEDGVVSGRVGVALDITERKALRQAQKQESLGVLAGGVAHDFNNLLVAMLGQTSLALSKMAPNSPAWPHVNKAVKAAERAADLTRQMLAYSGQGHFEIQLLDLNTLIQENLHLFEAVLPNNIRIKTLFTTPLPPIEADPGQMQQVIMNLILNSAEAIADRPGLIEILTQVQEYRADDSLFWQYTGVPMEPGPYVRLDVRDDGIGMDEATLSKIFEPFYTTKFTGRGLGLAVVLGIIRGHKGGLRVSSVPGLGAQFTLLFPASGGEEPMNDSKETNALTEKRSGVVLVIDDEEAVREAVSDILEIEAVRVLMAANGLEGIEIFEQHHEEIDLVLLDLSMPGLGGVETFRRLYRIDSTVPILLSSGYTQSEVDDRFPEERPAGFLQKPYSANVLVEEVMLRLGGQNNEF